MNEITPEQVDNYIQNKKTFVLNVVSSWCPDCTERQQPHFPAFAARLQAADISVYQITVQQERLVFLSKEHEKLVEMFGGHGYPRTVLVIQGVVQADSRVEVMTPFELDMMATEYIERVKELSLNP
jgi:thiol-disulfide isomerase/thioredoxin